MSALKSTSPTLKKRFAALAHFVREFYVKEMKNKPSKTPEEFAKRKGWVDTNLFFLQLLEMGAISMATLPEIALSNPPVHEAAFCKTPWCYNFIEKKRCTPIIDRLYSQWKKHHLLVDDKEKEKSERRLVPAAGVDAFCDLVRLNPKTLLASPVYFENDHTRRMECKVVDAAAEAIPAMKHFSFEDAGVFDKEKLVYFLLGQPDICDAKDCQQVYDLMLDRKPSMLHTIPVQFRTRARCEKAVALSIDALRGVPHELKTFSMCLDVFLLAERQQAPYHVMEHYIPGELRLAVREWKSGAAVFLYQQKLLVPLVGLILRYF